MSKNRFFGFAALLLALGLVAAACGDDTSAVDDTQITTTTTVPTTEPPSDDGMGESMDIVDTAIAAGSFETLAAALTAADLVDTLKGEGPFTVFAPTDDAFAALPEGTLEALLADIPTLTGILLYHVVPGAVDAATVVGLDSATTVEGSDITIEVIDGGVVLNGVTKVITTDIQASNGIIHVIDSVLLP